jgi:hypothetical protein
VSDLKVFWKRVLRLLLSPWGRRGAMHWRSSWGQTKVNGQEVENMEEWGRRLIADNRWN